MKKMNRVFVKSFVFAGALTLAAVVGTGSAEASGHHGDRTESQGTVQAKDEFYGKHNQKPVAKESHARPQKAEKVQQPVKAEKPVKVAKPVKEEKAVKTEKPVKDKSHSQGAEHASDNAKLHANLNSAIFAVDTEKEEPATEEPKTDEPAEVVVETPAVEDDTDGTEVETPAVEEDTEVIEVEIPADTDSEEGKTEDKVTDDQDATHENDADEDADKEESDNGENVKEVIVLVNKIRSLLLENLSENDKLYEAINAAILAFEEALKEDTIDDADAPAVPNEEDEDINDEVEVEVSTL